MFSAQRWCHRPGPELHRYPLRAVGSLTWARRRVILSRKIRAQICRKPHLDHLEQDSRSSLSRTLQREPTQPRHILAQARLPVCQSPPRHPADGESLLACLGSFSAQLPSQGNFLLNCASPSLYLARLVLLFRRALAVVGPSRPPPIQRRNRRARKRTKTFAQTAQRRKATTTRRIASGDSPAAPFWDAGSRCTSMISIATSENIGSPTDARS